MSTGSRYRKIEVAVCKEALADTFQQGALDEPPDALSPRKAMSFTVGSLDGPTLIRMKLHEAIIRNKMAGNQFRVRRHTPAPRPGLEVAAAILSNVIELTVNKLYAADDPNDEERVLSPLITLDAGERGEPWKVSFYPYPPSSFTKKGALDPAQFDIDLHETIARLFKDLHRVNTKGVWLQSGSGGVSSMTARNPRRIFDLLEMLFIKHGALTLDSCVGAPLLARSAKSPDKKVPYFATDLEYMTYSAAKIHEEQDKVADFAERHPDVFMENLLPTAFVSVAHAIHNSACAGSVDIKQLSLSELRVAFDANLRREKINPPQPLLAYH